MIEEESESESYFAGRDCPEKAFWDSGFNHLAAQCRLLCRDRFSLTPQGFERPTTVTPTEERSIGP
jgi:hypothetical protein